MGALDQAAQDALSSIFTVEQFRIFLIENLGITLLNEVVLATIANEFHLGTIEYYYIFEDQMHQFVWSATINVPPDEVPDDVDPETVENAQDVNAINANILIQVEDRTGDQKDSMVGQLIFL